MNSNNSENNTNRINCLLHEYNYLTQYFKIGIQTQFRILPLLITVIIGAGYFIIENSEQNISPFTIAILISAGLFLILLLLGYSHSTTNGIGLKLVILERKINGILGKSNNTEMSFFTDYIGHTFNKVLICNTYYGIIILVLSGAILWYPINQLATKLFCGNNTDPYMAFICALLIISCIVISIGLVYIPIKTGHEKEKLLNELDQKSQANNEDKKPD